MKKLVLATALSLALSFTTRAHAHRDASSELSALSMLPIAVSVAAPVMLLSAGGAFVVVSVSAVAEGTVWVLERASDGARMVLTFSGNVVGGASALAGATVVAVACSAGWVLSAAGQAIAFIPNEIGKALMYNERVTR
jgi:hypothetical protein